MPFNFQFCCKTLALISLVAIFSCQSPQTPADLIITHANIWTGNQAQPSAQAMAISGDTIMAIGTTAQILKYREDSTEVIEMQGELVTPGFIDGHVHFLTGGFNLSSVQLRDAGSPEEFARRIKEFASTLEPGTWILGGDWDHENWGGELPTKAWIDEFTPQHPVWVTRLDGHMSLANSLAMQMAGVDKNVKDIVGGTIIRDVNGQPTGIFKDNATILIGMKVPSASSEMEDKALQAAMDYVASNGVTSIHHMAGYMDALERARAEERLITRIYAMMPLSNWESLAEKVKAEGIGDKWLRIGGLKGFVDGSLGSHTAAFFDPYTDAPGDRGFFVNSREQLYEWIADADDAGLQVMVHAIGDSAINALLNTYEQIMMENGARDRRFRIEHAQHISPADIQRFGQLKVIPSMQPYHAIDDGRWAEKVIGPERIKTTYAFKSLFDTQATVVFGSDWFVAPPTPLEGIYAAVTRRTLDDKNPEGWVPEQKITVEQALIAYTKNAAYASFEEKIKGTLEVGKLADFVILDRDIFHIPAEQIRETKVLKTFVGGKMAYARGNK